MPRHALLDSQQLEEVDDDTVQRRALILSSCNRYAGQARRAVKAVSVVNPVGRYRVVRDRDGPGRASFRRWPGG